MKSLFLFYFTIQMGERVEKWYKNLFDLKHRRLIIYLFG